MREFTTRMELPDERPYEVLQRDARAHVVFDRQANTWGAVLFEAGGIEPAMPVLAVDRPCLLMVEAGEEETLRLSVSDPDLRLENNISRPLPLRVTLAGRWNLAEASEEFKISESGNDATVIEINARDGRSFDILLTRNPWPSGAMAVLYTAGLLLLVLIGKVALRMARLRA